MDLSSCTALHKIVILFFNKRSFINHPPLNVAINSLKNKEDKQNITKLKHSQVAPCTVQYVSEVWIDNTKIQA